ELDRQGIRSCRRRQNWPSLRRRNRSSSQLRSLRGPGSLPVPRREGRIGVPSGRGFRRIVWLQIVKGRDFRSRSVFLDQRLYLLAVCIRLNVEAGGSVLSVRPLIGAAGLQSFPTRLN